MTAPFPSALLLSKIWQFWPAACSLMIVAAAPETTAPETAVVTMAAVTTATMATATMATEGHFPMGWTGTRPQLPSLILYAGWSETGGLFWKRPVGVNG